MATRGIRGATTVESNSREEILAATKELLREMVAANALKIEDISSILFTLTADLNAEFPAVAAREIGWQETPLICAKEIEVPGSLPKCVRVLMHVNSNKEQKDIRHVYLKQAVNLRR
ncbi:chorismate mutase [candidate division WOR-1 bacterium RIFOXYA12_FULL_52_29]|uniref:chorismate mutase n=1 Tax=candidate division WOR-1 bacterium RIFOXYC12_FULL_54_18 TaxID=1802584 RepID=A0A1F4T3W9_UNCSA|nr:MAG: chorismate mutase [candidate division WOR-1 bacterium RIFOXYA2_FULL_51_19]OGC17005.1 MAG: chorismate mutase [candidate division WOR-1 bacterium RIFOXYA12_FULL_52_29]OGC25866.1 MAG: chorismate mutase [candidate division WOR-1 bacterium RIFOXYB2_FULL_45_9]OGC27422.1 MAG: chorismate mutase [candidate division WOR-1 bacterium RIFOXYC12_FULL_54_18]OGC29365.1 MAG: chorismate mutase [candidate division WOR-1 bacterium RIFOXYB12_FULL_52_16]